MSSAKKDWKKHFHRMKQIADQNLGRAEKSEVLNEDLVLLEKRVNKIKIICQNTIKKLTACLPLSGTANPDKNIKKLPESILAMTMMDSASALGNEDTLGKTYSYCAKLQNSLAREIYHYSQQIEKLVLSPIQSVLESGIPTIAKLRKQLTKLTLDMDSAKGRFQSVLKQSSGSSSASMASKVEMLKNELEQAESRVQQCRDQLIIEMYSFLAREGQLSDVLLALITSQIDFHRRTLESLENSLPHMKHHAEVMISRPVFGCSLVSHLDHTKREIAVVIEKCIRSLILHGIDEEGLFRVASSSTKVKKLKAGFDANIVNMDDYQEDPHCVAAALKSYLRELPEPLMTFELYSEWMHIMELPTELRQNALWVVVDKLPKPNYNNLRYIIKFLAKLAANSDVNKMSPSNIAIVIGPNLLWPPGDDGPSILTAASHSAIIEGLINKSEWFFPGDLDFGVTEADRLKVAKTRRNDNTSRGHNLSSVSSSTLTPSYISKHRFFGNVFDDSERNGLQMSSSSTRLSLNSLTSLNDESSFERKYSFSSLLEERTSNWDSEGGSMRWMKLSRVESGTSSLNTSFCYRNRSPIPSSSTSPALSAANILSLDASSLVNSVTKNPALSLTTGSSHLSGTSPPVSFGTGSTRFSGTSLTLSVGGRSDCAGSKIPTLSANKGVGIQATPAPLTLVSIAKAGAMSVSAGAKLSVNNGLIVSNPQKNSVSSSKSVTSQSQLVTTGSAMATSVVTTKVVSSTENFTSAVTTTPAMLLTTSPAVSLTTSATMSTTTQAVSVTTPTMSVINPTVSVTSSPAVTVTSPAVSVTSTPTASPTTSPAALLTTLPLTANRTISETDSPDSSTLKRQVLTQEQDSELVTDSECTDTPSLSSNESAPTDNYPIIISTTQHCFDPLMSGDPLHPISFSRHIVCSPSSPPLISHNVQEMYDHVFDTLPTSPGKDLNMTCTSDGHRRTRFFSEGTWMSVPNGDCRGAFIGAATIGARCGLDGNGAPGKERVRFLGLSKQTGSAACKERPNDRRLSIPSVIGLEMTNTKQPVKKSRSLSINSGRALPYEAPNYAALNANSSNRKTTMSSERHRKGLSDGNTPTLYEKNGETCCIQNSVMNCTENTVYLSANTMTLQESGMSLSGGNSLTREQNVLWNSDKNPNASSFGGLSTHSEKGPMAALEEYKIHCDDAFTAKETVLPKNETDKPETNRFKDELSLDCLSGCDLPNEMLLSVVTSIPADAPVSPLSPAEKKNPPRPLQRPLFPPPPPPPVQGVPAKHLSTLD